METTEQLVHVHAHVCHEKSFTNSQLKDTHAHTTTLYYRLFVGVGGTTKAFTELFCLSVSNSRICECWVEHSSWSSTCVERQQNVNIALLGY